MSQILLPIGGMSVILAGLIVMWDINNEFLPWILGLGIISTGIGVVLNG